MTINEDLLHSFQADAKPVYRIYEPEAVCIVLGAGRKAEEDVRPDQAAADNIPVFKRRGGGGTVVLSTGQVVFALVAKVASPFNNLEYSRILSSWVRESLESLGICNVKHRGISDLAIENRKILGSSIYRRRLILFYQASLLVNNDITMFSRYLTYPSRVPDYRQGRDHGSFCTTLAGEGNKAGVTDVINALEKVVTRRIIDFS